MGESTTGGQPLASVSLERDPPGLSSPAISRDRLAKSTVPADTPPETMALPDSALRSSIPVRFGPLEWLGSDSPPPPLGIPRQRFPTD